MGETLVELVAKISADATELREALAESEKDVQGLGKTIGRESKSWQDQFKDVGKVMAGAGATITAALGLATKSFVKTGSELNDLSLKTGISAKALAGLKYAAEQSGGSLNSIETAVRSLGNIMSDAGDDMETAQRSLNKLGLSVASLQGLNPEQQFLKIANAIAQIPDPMMRSALAVDLFGRSGTDMLPMLSEGAAGLQRMMEAGVKLTGWTDEGAESADTLGDSFGTLKTASSGLFNVIGESLAPALETMTGYLTNIISDFKDWGAAHPELTRTLSTFALTIGAMLTTLGGIMMIVPRLTDAFVKMKTMMVGAQTSTVAFSGALVGLAVGLGMIMYGLQLLSEHRERYAAVVERATLINIELTKAYEGQENAAADMMQTWLDEIKLRQQLGQATKDEIKWLEKNEQQWLNLISTLKEAIKVKKAVAEATEESQKLGVEFQEMMRGLLYNESAAGKLGLTMEDVYMTMNKLGRTTAEIKAVFDRYGTTVEVDMLLLDQLGLTAEQIARIVGKLTDETFEGAKGFEGLGDAATTAADKIESAADKIKRLTGFTPEGVAANWPVSGEALAPQASLWANVLDLRSQGKWNEANALLPAVNAGFTNLYGYAEGGIVPGPVGAPQLAMVHGGETITPANEGTGNITIQFTQPVFFDREDQLYRFADIINKAIDRKNRLRFGGAYNG
jgi:hypothetical protein